MRREPSRRFISSHIPDMQVFFKKAYLAFLRLYYLVIGRKPSNGRAAGSGSLPTVSAEGRTGDGWAGVGRKVLVTAHRGASGHMPENTLGAIALAMEMGADCVEIDVQLTRDGELVLLHDHSLWRTTTGRGKIWNIDFADLKRLDAGSWYAPQFKDEKVPSLREVIRLVRGRLQLDIELKSHPRHKELPQKVVQLLEEEDFVDCAVITSFDMDILRKVRQLNPVIRLGLISSLGIPARWVESDLDWFVGHASIVDAELVEFLHRLGKEVHVWTVNRPLNMRRFISMGVDGIITDRPDLLKMLLQKWEIAVKQPG